MFRNKLLMAFLLLGLAALAQGTITAFALKTANDNVQRGRLANELYAGFIELLSQKHQLRLGLTNAIVGINNDPQQRQVFYAKMLRTLDNLDTLAIETHHLNRNDLSKEPEHQQRLESIQLLRKGVLQVGETMETEAYSRRATSPEEKLMLLTDIFDIADEEDLRATLLQSISRERLATARDRTAADVSLQFMNSVMLVATSALILCMFALAWYFYLALSRPIDRLVRGATALRQGNLAYRIPHLGKNEFANLAQSMNSMASEIAELSAKEKQIKSELESQVEERTRDFKETLHRLEKVDLRRKQMFADISHELRTPTTAIRGEAEITLRYNTSNLEDYRTTLTKIVDYSHALSRVIDDMLTLARSDIDAFVLDRQPICFYDICQRAVTNSHAATQNKFVQLKKPKHLNAWVLGDGQRLEQVLRIGLENALSYSPANTCIQVDATPSNDQEGLGYVTCRIRNEGAGVSEKELSRVFDRHFRGAHAQSVRPDGSGLGLALAKTIVHAHRGNISINSAENEYTELTITLPILEIVNGDKV
jgi:signal transduction histidine kinase